MYNINIILSISESGGCSRVKRYTFCIDVYLLLSSYVRIKRRNDKKKNNNKKEYTHEKQREREKMMVKGQESHGTKPHGGTRSVVHCGEYLILYSLFNPFYSPLPTLPSPTNTFPKAFKSIRRYLRINSSPPAFYSSIRPSYISLFFFFLFFLYYHRLVRVNVLCKRIKEEKKSR